MANASDLMTSSASLPRQRRRAVPVVVVTSAAVLALIALAGLLAPWIAPHGYAEQDLLNRLAPPVFLDGSWDYPLGTDNLGRDLLSRLLYGIRTSVLIALTATVLGFVFGTTLGFLAALRRGVVEEGVMMLADVQAAIPTLILALAVLAFVGNSLGILIVLVALDGWERYARLARAQVLAAKESGYVAAMQVIGAPGWRLALVHILPNVLGALVVQATLNFPGTIMLETALSFFGLGVQPPETSLGQMLGTGRNYLLGAWWIAVLPGTVIFVTTLAACLLGDWLRDRIDPTLERP
ncbi:ABC transporter permease [Rhodobacter sp. NTK016B]|uniref:ABC transporter permease n=1 Tax=Rhodobacter sp. NTK016B TaxID=2759676 RepID=UPI001A8E3F10|nr:ABC transporter permease [Rhodobacter sp. NTK016B]MBN8290992.1 ABC transporter permease [Rhodobacter sp. NTK016B]